MSTGATPEEHHSGTAHGPVAPDRPAVDGRSGTPEDLRAEAERQSRHAEVERRIEADRAALAATVAELAERLDVRARAREVTGRATGRLAEYARRPAVQAGLAAVVLLVVLLRRRR